MKSLFSVLLTLLSLVALNAAAEADSDVIKFVGERAYNGGLCHFSADYSYFAPDRDKGDLTVYFDGTDREMRRGASASAFINLIAAVDAGIIEDLLWGEEDAQAVEGYGTSQQLITASTQDGIRTVTFQPLDEEAWKAEFQSYQWAQIKIQNGEVIEMRKKHWRRRLIWGSYSLVFDDTCLNMKPSEGVSL